LKFGQIRPAFTRTFSGRKRIDAPRKVIHSWVWQEIERLPPIMETFWVIAALRAM
jgi:hypothetical protein